MKHQLTGEGGKGSKFRDTNLEAYNSNFEQAMENTRKQREKRIELGCDDPYKALCDCKACKTLT